MFKFALVSGSPVNVGQMVEVAAGTANARGDVGQITTGSFAFSASACPGAVVSDIADGKAVAMILTPDVVVEAPVSGTDSQIGALKAGAFIKFTQTGVDASATSAFCQIVDTNSAKTAGDKIYVRFVGGAEAT